MCSNAVHIIPDATLYHFGVLTSSVHMAWTRVVCGRLKSDYRYSKDIVYNNFPWPEPTEAQRERIGRTTQAILDARAGYPDSSLADLYDPLTMPADLRQAHADNDRAVAEGAAIYAAQHDGFATETTIGNDLSSHSYGMRSYIRGTDQEMVFNLIKRDDPLVFDQTHTFCTRGDKQTSALIQIYETDSVDDKVELTEARLLEKKEINWGSPVDKDTNITLHVIRAKDGIVHIEAECQNSRARFDITPRGLITDDDAEPLREIITNLEL